MILLCFYMFYVDLSGVAPEVRGEALRAVNGEWIMWECACGAGERRPETGAPGGAFFCFAH